MCMEEILCLLLPAAVAAAHQAAATLKSMDEHTLKLAQTLAQASIHKPCGQKWSKNWIGP